MKYHMISAIYPDQVSPAKEYDQIVENLTGIAMGVKPKITELGYGVLMLSTLMIRLILIPEIERGEDE